MQQKMNDTTDKKEHRTDNSVYVAIAGEVVNRRSLLLKNFVLNGQESASNPLLHIHANHYQIFIKPNSMIEEFTLWSTIQTKSKCYVIKKY